MHIAIWIISLLALGLWTLFCWAVAAVLAIDPAWVGDLRPLVDQLPFGGVLDVWVPGWEGMVRSLLDLTQTLLGWLGSSAGWLVWAVWAAGALVVLGIAALLSLVVTLVRRSSAPAQRPPGGQGGNGSTAGI